MLINACFQLLKAFGMQVLGVITCLGAIMRVVIDFRLPALLALETKVIVTIVPIADKLKKIVRMLRTVVPAEHNRLWVYNHAYNSFNTLMISYIRNKNIIVSPSAAISTKQPFRLSNAQPLWMKDLNFCITFILFFIASLAFCWRSTVIPTQLSPNEVYEPITGFVHKDDPLDLR